MKNPRDLTRLTTGSASFDRILGGGIPVRSSTVIAGVPGVGKTLFALQMLFHQARQGRKSLFFTTLSEPSLKLLGYMQQLSYFDDELVGREIVLVDLGSTLRNEGASAALRSIMLAVEREEPAIVVIDSFKAIRDILDDASVVRTFVYDLVIQLAAWNAAALLLGEYVDDELSTLSEFAIADGIIQFANRHQELTAAREVEVLKLRGSGYISGRHFFEISRDGIEFFPRVRAPDDVSPPSTSPSEPVQTGVAGLDAMLGGGLPHSSATVIHGGTGTGKTLLGLHFLLEGARAGEPGVLFTLEETPDQLRWIAQSYGWDLAALEQRGLITLSYASPVELSTDIFLARARRQLEQTGAKRAALDSLTSLALGIPSDRRFKELVYAITKHFRALGVTLSMSMETEQRLGSGQLSGYGISFAADNVIQLRYLELDGALVRGVSVLKARGVRHESEVRRMSIGTRGVEIGAGFEGLYGVLTGLPVPRRQP